MNFATALSRIMHDHKLSQWELATQSGAHQTSISLYVLGKTLPSTKALNLLLKARDADERISLITAFLRDTANEIGVDPQEIAIQVGAASGKPNLADVLDTDLYDIIYALAIAASTKPELREYLRSTAYFLKPQEAVKPAVKPTPKPAATPVPAADHKKRATARKAAKSPSARKRVA